MCIQLFHTICWFRGRNGRKNSRILFGHCPVWIYDRSLRRHFSYAIYLPYPIVNRLCCRLHGTVGCRGWLWRHFFYLCPRRRRIFHVHHVPNHFLLKCEIFRRRYKTRLFPGYHVHRWRRLIPFNHGKNVRPGWYSNSLYRSINMFPYGRLVWLAGTYC